MISSCLAEPLEDDLVAVRCGDGRPGGQRITRGALLRWSLGHGLFRLGQRIRRVIEVRLLFVVAHDLLAHVRLLTPPGSSKTAPGAARLPSASLTPWRSSPPPSRPHRGVRGIEAVPYERSPARRVQGLVTETNAARALVVRDARAMARAFFRDDRCHATDRTAPAPSRLGSCTVRADPFPVVGPASGLTITPVLLSYGITVLLLAPVGAATESAS